jgi:hypothetical protein
MIALDYGGVCGAGVDGEVLAEVKGHARGWMGRGNQPPGRLTLRHTRSLALRPVGHCVVSRLVQALILSQIRQALILSQIRHLLRLLLLLLLLLLLTVVMQEERLLCAEAVEAMKK